MKLASVPSNAALLPIRPKILGRAFRRLFKESVLLFGFAPVMVARRTPVDYELLTGHQRIALAQEASVRFPAVVMDTGENVWIEPDGSVVGAK